MSLSLSQWYDILIWLVVSTPLKNISSSVGIGLPNIWKKITKMLQATKQIWYGDGSKPWYLVNPKIAGKWMFIPLKCIYRYWPIPIYLSNLISVSKHGEWEPPVDTHLASWAASVASEDELPGIAGIDQWANGFILHIIIMNKPNNI